MRTISGSLTTAIGAKTRRPAITLTVEDHIMHLNNNVATAGNADGWSDMCVAADGSIVRVRVTYGGGGFDFVQNFQYQRVTNPTNASQWTTWTTFTGGSGNMWDSGSCAISDNGGVLRAFAQQGTGGAALWCWTSLDNGVTWSGPVVVVTPPGSALIKGVGSSGNNDVFFLYDTVGGEVIGASFHGVGWSAMINSSAVLSKLVDGRGLAVVWDGVKYTICYADPYSVYASTYTPGTNTWAYIGTVSPSDSQALGRTSPRLSLMDGIYNLIYIESDAGTYTGETYSYPRVRQSIDLLNWSSGIALHDMPTTFNCNIVKTQTPSASRQQYIAVTAKLVEYSNAYLQSDTSQYVDLSHYVMGYKREEDLGKPAKITVKLDNQGGQLNGYVSNYGVTYKPIGLHTSLVLSEGYYTGTPPTVKEVVNVARYVITDIGFDRAPGHSILELTGEDITHHFDYEGRWQSTYINNSVGTMLQNVVTLSGLLSINLPVLAQLSDLVPTFATHAGSKWRVAVDELSRVGWVEYFLDQTETLQVVQLNANDASVWTYQPEIETLNIGSDEDRSNHILVSGRPPKGPGTLLGSVLNAEVFDDTHMHVTGVERFVAYNDQKLYTWTLVSDKATFLMRQEQRGQIEHTVTVPVNPALQLCDVITLTDQAAGVSGTGQTVVCRIWRQDVVFLAEKAEFWQMIYLEGL